MDIQHKSQYIQGAEFIIWSFEKEQMDRKARSNYKDKITLENTDTITLATITNRFYDAIVVSKDINVWEESMLQAYKWKGGKTE